MKSFARTLCWLPFLALLSLPVFGQAETPKQPRASKECAICHLRWADDFEATAGKDYLLEFSEEKVVATEMMCYSCHDGSIVDSRLRVWETSRHKAGTEPSSAISIPENYPLDPQGRLICATCHSAHGVDSTTDMGSTIFLREPNVNSSMCRKCHQDKDDGPAAGKHPIDVEFEAFPAAILEAGGKAGAGKSVICETCHTPHGSTNEHFLVIPNSKEGLTHAMLCETCHTVSPDIKSDDVLRRYSHPVAVDLMREAALPERWDNGEMPYLAEGTAVNCRTCHSPHNGTPSNHLLVSKNENSSLCLTCHTSKKKLFGTKHDIAQFYPEEKNADGRTAAETGACFACHAMHKGRGPKMWARDTDGETIADLCQSCHQKGKLAQDALTGKRSHPIEVQPPSGMRTEGLPLYGEKGRKDPEGKVTCASCHDPHAWSASSDERGGKEAQGNGNNSFLRKSALPNSALCRSCHSDKSPILGSKHDLGLMFPESKNAKVQTVRQSGTCGFCHAPHNALGEKLWSLKARDAGDVIEGLCDSCHAKGGLAEQKTTGHLSHPIGAIPKLQGEFRETLPLFTASGKKDKKGAVTCATCHDLHRWEAGKDKGPGDRKIEGDRFNSFLRAPYDDNAKLCSACHEENALVVKTDHDLRITAPSATNLLEQTVDQSGVCGACHLVHNAFGNRLWARGVGPGGDRNQALCAGCHARRKAASHKTLPEPNHPMNMALTDAKRSLRNRLETDLPLFDSEGERSEQGTVSCPTCHNVHRWDPDKAVAGAGENLEGDGGTSFLRKSNLPNSGLCTSCHNLKGYVVGTDHDMHVTAPEAKNQLDMSVSQSGVCSACHVPHGAKNDGYLLWARDLGGANAFRPEQLCLSCHAAGKEAQHKVPTKLRHPLEVQANSLSRSGPRLVRGYMPLFDKDGNNSEAGAISCPTCHDPHRWSSDVELERGTGQNEEGNSRSSFLRERSKFGLCSNCHGMDALFRYKFFHGEVSREKHELYRDR